MKLPLTQIPTNTGAITLFDADGVKVGTIRTDAVHAAYALNCGNANHIIHAVNEYEATKTAMMILAAKGERLEAQHDALVAALRQIANLDTLDNATDYERRCIATDVARDALLAVQ